MTKHEFGSIKVGENKIVALSPIPLNVIYFDDAPSLSFLHGVIGVTLTVRGNVPIAEREGVETVASVAAYLKCNIPAALALKAAIENALLLAAPVENPDGPKN